LFHARNVTTQFISFYRWVNALDSQEIQFVASSS